MNPERPRSVQPPPPQTIPRGFLSAEALEAEDAAAGSPRRREPNDGMLITIEAGEQRVRERVGWVGWIITLAGNRNLALVCPAREMAPCVRVARAMPHKEQRHNQLGPRFADALAFHSLAPPTAGPRPIPLTRDAADGIFLSPLRVHTTFLRFHRVFRTSKNCRVRGGMRTSCPGHRRKRRTGLTSRSTRRFVGEFLFGWVRGGGLTGGRSALMRMRASLTTGCTSGPTPHASCRRG